MQIFHLLMVIVQVLLAIGLILIIAFQTTKSEQGGLGIGTIGGQATTSVHKFGLEAQLTRVTTWIAVSYFVLSFLAAFVEAHLN